MLWAVKEKAKPGGRLTARQRAHNHRFGKVRAKVENVFRVVKCHFGYRNVRYRGIAKNGAGVADKRNFRKSGVRHPLDIRNACNSAPAEEIRW